MFYDFVTCHSTYQTILIDLVPLWFLTGVSLSPSSKSRNVPGSVQGYSGYNDKGQTVKSDFPQW